MKFNVKEMYRVTPAPPKWELQEYIRKYLETKEETYFFWFLHYYEPQMNKRVYDYSSMCDVKKDFADIKQSMAIGLYKALYTYDISLSPFLYYADRYMDREVEEFFRFTVPPYSIQSEFEYSRLRKIMVLFQENGEKADRETIQLIADQVGINPEKVVAILAGGLRNENRIDNYDENGEERDELYIDADADPAIVFARRELFERVYFAYFSLEFTERLMLSQHLGFCPKCLSVYYRDKNDLDENGVPKLKEIKPMPYTDIATSHGLSDPDTAKRICEGALSDLYEMIKVKEEESDDSDDDVIDQCE